MSGRDSVGGCRGIRPLDTGASAASGPAAHRGVVLTALMLAVVFAWCARPSVAFSAPTADPHADLLSSPLGCPACHLFIEGPASDFVCVSCHVASDADGPTVYAGDEANYRNEDGFGHNDPTTVSCLDCHTIHGPTIASPALTGMLLRELDYQSDALDAVNLLTASHDTALSVWCTGCHPQWPEPYVPGTSVIHPFAPREPGVTWNDCTSCFSCHAASGGFPHYTPGADAGLVGASAAGAERLGVVSRWLDGVCLGCHRSVESDGPRGVGVGY